MKRVLSVFLVAILSISLFVPPLSVASASDSVKVSMSFDGVAKVGQKMVLRITVAKPTKELAGLEFALDFDSAMVTPSVTTNDESGSKLATLITQMPKNWGQMCHYSETEKRYYFRFVMPEDGVGLKNENEIIIDIPFTVKATGVVTFKIPNKDIIAVVNDSNLSMISGKGEEFSTVASGETEKFAVNLSENEAANENGLYYLNVTVTNIGDSDGIIALEFDLNYNNAYFQPFITKNDNEQMNGFIKSSPQNGWEQMCTLYESQSKYTLRFAALHAESVEECEKLEIGKSIKLAIPFKVVGKEGQSATFSCDTANSKGLNNSNQKVKGVGDTKTVSISERTSSIPQWVYENDKGLIFAPDNTTIPTFLAPLGDAYVVSNGNKIADGLVKTGYVLKKGNETFTIVVKGDINCNGIVDSMDYVFAKRAYYATYKVEGASFYAAAVSNGEKIISMDYVYIKRHYFGTYDLSKIG